MKFENQIGYWAEMLNESMADKSQPYFLHERRMTGPAAAARGGVDEIADMRQKLDSGVVEFEFWKHNPEGGPDILRHAVGTTSEAVVSTADRRRMDPNYDENLESYNRRSAFIIWFWDLEKNAVRYFNTNRFERIVNYEQTQQRAGMNVRRFGNIFVNREDDGEGEGEVGGVERIDDAQADDLTQQLLQAGQGGDLREFTGGIDFAAGGEDIAVEADNGTPVLVIEIYKNGVENAPPLNIDVNGLRRYIRQHWHVEIKRVDIRGQIRYN